MGEPSRQTTILNVSKELSEGTSNNKNIKEKITQTHTEELIIAFCGPIGTDIHFATERFAHIIEEKFRYKIVKIRLSSLIKDYSSDTNFENLPRKNEYYHKLIQAGNKLRERYGNSILAELAINEIAVTRETIKEKEKDTDFKSKRICYLIDSIKTNEELELLRLIYRDIFYFIGAFSSIDIRSKFLEDKGIAKDQVYKLITDFHVI